MRSSTRAASCSPCGSRGKLDVPVKRSLSSGPGLTAVRMQTDCGAIVLDRPDGSLATLSIQGQPDRAVALKRRETSELIAEELRRLDPDDTYAAALKFGVDRLGDPADRATATDGQEPAASAAAPATAPAKKAAAKKAPAKSAAKKSASKAAAK